MDLLPQVLAALDDDLDLIGTRRRPENRLGLALHIALLRHPGQGWHDDTEPPAPLVAWLAEQIKVPFPSLTRYGSREATRSNYNQSWLIERLGFLSPIQSCSRTGSLIMVCSICPRNQRRYSSSLQSRSKFGCLLM